MKKLNKLPKWFNGTIYDTGEIVTNPFSGEEYKLTNLELSMYDFIIGCNMVFATGSNRVNDEMIRDFEKGLDWFRKTNAKAYMVLLD
tara:strand:- start:89 stop:349 length:261 start_codon:yes stop_codon:yes gene_type:complete